MAWSPAVKQLNVLQQGGERFPNVSEWIDTVVLAANAAASYDLVAARTAMGLAANAPLFVIFSADGGFWAHCHAAAAIPAASTTNGTSAEYAPNQKYIDSSVTAISLIASAATHVAMQFFKT